jgi:hypothetical protein
MKVLVATGQTQGMRENDYHWATEGELVRVGEVCRKDRGNPDGGCGCGRGFAGLNSHRATTTARVAEVPLNHADYVEAIRSSLAQQGWDPSWAVDEADNLAELAAYWPVGTIIERRLDALSRRALPSELPT